MNQELTQPRVIAEVKRPVGRPRKDSSTQLLTKRPVGRPRKDRAQRLPNWATREVPANVTETVVVKPVKTKPIKLGRQYALPKKSGWVVVGPDLAQAWLVACNLLNRPLVQRHVDNLARNMKMGYWVSNEDAPISFDEYGMLLNGQHRLAAVVASGVPIRFWVAVNVTSAARKIADTGRIRTPAEILFMEGVKYAPWVVQAVNLIYRIEGDRIWNLKTSTVSDIRAYLDLYPEIKDLVPWAGTKVLYRLFKSHAVPCGCYCLFYRTHKDKATAFFQAILDGVAHSADDPVAVLRNFLTTIDPKLHPRISQNLKVLATYKAFIAYLNGEKLARLKVSENEPLPELPSASN
jgi:hypothetical protein